MVRVKRIKGFEQLYSITTEGEVIASSKFITGNNGGRIFKEEKTLRPGKTEKGYLFVVLQHKGKKKHKSIHRLVAEAFIPNPENKPIINHKDGNKANNRMDNLEWATYSENSKHAVETGLRKYLNISGEKGGLAKITNEQAKEIREKYHSSPSQTSRKLAKEYGIDKSNILRIVHRKTFKNVR